MKQFIFLAAIFSSPYSFAQKKLPVIKASSANAFIVEGPDDKTNWTLSPEAHPDIYQTSKSVKPQWVKFYTDIDSLKIKLEPGSTFDFVVLLNNKDSCFTRFESPEIKNFSKRTPAIHDTIPFMLTAYNNIKLKVVLDKKDTLNLKFDSGSTDFRLTNNILKDLHIDNLNAHLFQIGKQLYEMQQINPVVLSGHGTDGRFGWNLFDGEIIEIDYNKNLFIIHSSLPKIGRDYEKFAMEYVQGLFCIYGELQIKNNRYASRFLFDNGYQRTIMLDDDLMKEQDYPKDSLEVIKKVIMKNGQGKEIPVLTVNNEKLNLGKYTLTNIPVQLLATGNPAGFKTHILGNEVLKRFNVILNFQKNIIYLKSNGLYDMPYTEQKKDGA